MTYDDMTPTGGNGHFGGDGHGEDHDPEIAGRFAMLDRVSPPQTWPPRPAAETVRPIWPVWQSVGLAAAAALLLAVGLVALLPDGDDDGSVVVDAANGPRLGSEEPDPSDRPRSGGEDGDRAAFDDDGSGKSTTVPERTRPTAPDETKPTLSIRPSETEPTTPDPDPTRPTVTGPIDTKPVETEPTETKPTIDESVPTRPTYTLPIDPIPPKPVPTRPLPTITIIDPSPTISLPITLPPETKPIDPEDGEHVTFGGIVTEVFTDCASRLVLNDDGEVEQVGPVSCDGGSYIVVDGTQIRTSAGFVPQDRYYDKHPTGLLPGQRVTVVAVAVHYGERVVHTLDCDRCGVSISR